MHLILNKEGQSLDQPFIVIFLAVLIQITFSK